MIILLVCTEGEQMEECDVTLVSIEGEQIEERDFTACMY